MTWNLRPKDDGVVMRKVKVSYFTSKMGFFGNSRELQFRASKLLQKLPARPTNKAEDKKEEVGSGCFEGKSIGQKQELRRWLFLIG